MRLCSSFWLTNWWMLMDDIPEMQAYPQDDGFEHDLEGPCSCAFSVQEVVWDDEPDTVYLLVLHSPMGVV